MYHPVLNDNSLIPALLSRVMSIRVTGGVMVVMTYKITREITTELFTYMIISDISYINQLQCNKVAPSRFSQALLRVDNVYNRSVSLWMITAADTDSLTF